MRHPIKVPTRWGAGQQGVVESQLGMRVIPTLTDPFLKRKGLNLMAEKLRNTDLCN